MGNKVFLPMLRRIQDHLSTTPNHQLSSLGVVWRLTFEGLYTSPRNEHQTPIGKGVTYIALVPGVCVCIWNCLCLQTDGHRVDPASSHMLIAKIKPCMSKYKRILWNCEWLIKSVTVVILELIHASKLRFLEAVYLLDKKKNVVATKLNLFHIW
jgi:hypothetical protein